MSSSNVVQVELINLSGNSIGTCGCPSDSTVEILLNELAEHFQYPARKDGRPIRYGLHWKRGARDLGGNETLASAGVQNGDFLTVTATASVAERVDADKAVPRDSMASDQEITVTVVAHVDNYGRAPTQETLDVALTAGTTIQVLVNRLNLNETLAGAPVPYRLASKALGILLPEGQTLRQIGVPMYDTLTLSTEKVAGLMRSSPESVS